MDPLSVTAGVVGLLGAVSKLSSIMCQFREDYKLADEELNAARSCALLLRDELRGLELEETPAHPSGRKRTKDDHDPTSPAETKCCITGTPAFNRAISTATQLLSDIETSFPLRSDPHTWRSKVRWAMKDKKVFAQLQGRLRSTESTFQGILSMEQLRITRLIHDTVVRQQAALDLIVKRDILSSRLVNTTIVSQTNIQSTTTDWKTTPPTSIDRTLKRHSQLITRPTKLLPRNFEIGHARGFSAQLASLPKEGRGRSYRVTIQFSVFGKKFSYTFQTDFQRFSFDRFLHVRNIVPVDCKMVTACKLGDFRLALQLLRGGLAHGSDVTPEGRPILDVSVPAALLIPQNAGSSVKQYAIESGSAPVVRLLLDHGASPDMAYGDSNMTALQSSFLHSNVDISRMLLSRGADIEHVDNDGYSVLSYLWVVDGQLEKSLDFMRLCQAAGFSEVNSCDDRGWTAFHRAAAVGKPEDIEAFLQLGASLALRAEWYGWTALFFAASHDNLGTFEALVRHSGDDVYESLDGDGWTLLHCCVYFGAPRVMRLVLENIVDVNQKTHPAPLPEDPELSYRQLTASDIALYVGPNRYRMFMEILAEAGRQKDLDDNEIFWDASCEGLSDGGTSKDSEAVKPSRTIYGAEDIDDRWSLLHWASYNGCQKVQRLLLLKGADPEHLDAIMLEDNPTLLPASPFGER